MKKVFTTDNILLILSGIVIIGVAIWLYIKYGKKEKSTATPPTTAGANTPTAEEYIRMSDRYMTWDDVYKFAAKLGITDKEKVHNAQDTGIISQTSRRHFYEVVFKYPDWKKLFKAKADELKIPYSSEEQFRTVTESMIRDYGIVMAE